MHLQVLVLVQVLVQVLVLVQVQVQVQVWLADSPGHDRCACTKGWRNTALTTSSDAQQDKS
jgi:hypothetical protein